MADSPFTASLAALSRFFVGDATLEDTLERVAGLAVEAIAPADMAGVMGSIGGIAELFQGEDTSADGQQPAGTTG